MNNYCSNCGHALIENDKKCPECGVQIANYHKVLSRRIQWNIVMKINFTWILLIALVLIFVLSSVTGLSFGYRSFSERYYFYFNEAAFAVGMFVLFLNTILAMVFFFVNRLQFLLHKCTEQQWITTILLFILSFLVWLPYIFTWSEGNW